MVSPYDRPGTYLVDPTICDGKRAKILLLVGHLEPVFVNLLAGAMWSVVGSGSVGKGVDGEAPSYVSGQPLKRNIGAPATHDGGS